MREREPRKETIGKGELFYLNHPGTEDTFSGYGLATRPGTNEFLVGLLMVDRPSPVDLRWLERVQAAFGEYHLIPMTATGERGIACQMQIEQDSLPHLRQFPGDRATAIQSALEPLLDQLPNPAFSLLSSDTARSSLPSLYSGRRTP